MKTLLVLIVGILSTQAFAVRRSDLPEIDRASGITWPWQKSRQEPHTYYVQAVTGSTLTIEGHVYTPKRVCTFWVDDKVMFADGNPNTCTSITIINLRTDNSCEVYCP